jgi:hypothetical protein
MKIDLLSNQRLSSLIIKILNCQSYSQLFDLDLYIYQIENYQNQKKRLENCKDLARLDYYCKDNGFITIDFCNDIIYLNIENDVYFYNFSYYDFKILLKQVRDTM